MARAGRSLREQLVLADAVLEVLDGRCPLSSAPLLPTPWSRAPRLVVLTHSDGVGRGERRAWLAHFERAAGVEAERVESERTGDGSSMKLANSATPAAARRRPPLLGALWAQGLSGEGLYALRRRLEPLHAAVGVAARQARGLRPRALRLALVGAPNVGKSALLNGLLGRRAAESANRPGVTREVRWVRAPLDVPRGEELDGASRGLVLDLMDSPGVLPPRLADPGAALRLAVCGDFAEAALPPERAAAGLLDLLQRAPGGAGRRQGLHRLLQRCGRGPDAVRDADGALLPEAYLAWLADKAHGGREEQAGRRILKDYREGRLGAFGLDQVP